MHSANFIVWLSAPLTLEFCNIKKNNRFFTNSDSAFTKVIGFLSMIAPAAPKFGSYIQVSLRNRKIKCLLMFSDFWNRKSHQRKLLLKLNWDRLCIMGVFLHHAEGSCTPRSQIERIAQSRLRVYGFMCAKRVGAIAFATPFWQRGECGAHSVFQWRLTHVPFRAKRISLRVLEKIENGFSGICFMVCWINARALQRLQCGAEENISIKYSRWDTRAFLQWYCCCNI